MRFPKFEQAQADGLRLFFYLYGRMEKRVTYSASNTYTTLNTLGPQTTHVWWVFHGIGYLSRYFLKHFKGLPPHNHYLIAPQAPSKYYLNDRYTHVGASWLTRENTVEETENVLSYLDAVVNEEQLPNHVKTVVMGFSQGVSVSLRWLAKRNIPVDELVVYAGGIPNELKPEDLAHLFPRTRVSIIYGDQDPFLTPERIADEQIKIDSLFGEHSRIIEFQGGHEIKEEVLRNIAEEN